MTFQHRLADLGLMLPKPAAPVAAYVPTVEVHGLLYISGQLPLRSDGTLIAGRLGEMVDLDTGVEAARCCGLMLLAQIGAALAGNFERLERIVKLGAFIASAPTFIDQPKVANGVSELMVTLFDERGRHARSAVGVSVLPLGAAVEVDAIIAVRAG